MSDGSKPHVGGTVTKGVDGVLIDGIPVAIKGSKCVCTGSPKPNSITIGSPGVFIDGEQVAIVGSMTEHGGVIIDGVPGVTISGGFAMRAENPEKPEPRIFNLQWRKKSFIIRDTNYEETVLLSADTVGYEDGEEVALKIYEEGSDEIIDEVKGIVENGRLEVEWKTKNEEEK
ncbi:putative Zn-binding protein involved in type VI secretion [Dysgonomonas alginatilytica]|uniref:Putative Zn-binding protein involved in type VI secretion n=2 Tax=Dysgonomonas alginatilytica TaxID=1605892 RepID=A0A2V3PQ41_9BACT|nr:putative Zn-binding protein involved in type VI secretion [Dysgonomonas alginatilytica]